MSDTIKPVWGDAEKNMVRNAIAALKNVRFMPPETKPYVYGLDSVILDLEEALNRGRAL